MNLRFLPLAATLVLALVAAPAASAQEGKYIPATPDLKKGIVDRLPKPFYPAALARGARPEGTVVLRMYVAESGQVAQTKVQKSSGSADLDKAALEFVKAFKFSPYIVNSKPVAWFFDYNAPYKAPAATAKDAPAPKRERPE